MSISGRKFGKSNIAGPMMTLSEAVLDAIKNKSYSLRPIEREDRMKKSKPKEVFGIAQILARRMAMGFGDILEGEEVIDSNIISVV